MNDATAEGGWGGGMLQRCAGVVKMP